jgi:hypothetical protein
MAFVSPGSIPDLSRTFHLVEPDCVTFTLEVNPSPHLSRRTRPTATLTPFLLPPLRSGDHPLAATAIALAHFFMHV